jgi:preprotein translocase subunit SecA
VRDNEVVLIEITDGRMTVMAFSSEGLHQLDESERGRTLPENVTLAFVTF